MSLDRSAVGLARNLADQAFSRAAGGPLVGGNRLVLLKDAPQNYPAWLKAISEAKHHVHFESYIFHDDASGQAFAEALIERAQSGVKVRVVYDWWGCFSASSSRYWEHLRKAGVEVRVFNPPRLDSPIGWLSRDHRKTVSIDGRIGFVSGLCVGQMWMGDPAKQIEPWRDTGVEFEGPAVVDLEHAFSEIWAGLGPPLARGEWGPQGEPQVAGNTAMRVVATVPATAGLLPVSELTASLARQRLWLTDAYYSGTMGYERALRAAARDGVDIRLLLPGASDIPAMKPLSRIGYRPLLEAGVRIFEWNGVMLHAKTAVADSKWARVGSTNLNLASWFGNCEMDVLVEDEAFARQMEAQYEEDLQNATEIVLDEKQVVRGAPPRRRRNRGKVVAAGAARLGNTLGAALMRRRTLEPVEGRLTTVLAVVLLAVATVAAVFPKALAWPLAGLVGWSALSLLYRGLKLVHDKSRR